MSKRWREPQPYRQQFASTDEFLPSNKPPMALPTNAELDILAVIWTLGMATVREVHDQLGKDNRYTTTLKTIQLMTEKGLLIRGDSARASHLPQGNFHIGSLPG